MEREKPGFVEEQFHQQFSENYNNMSGYIITFVVGLLSVIVGLGYCIKSYLLCSDSNQFKYLLLLEFTFIAVIGVLATVNYLVIELGWSMRRDQFIVHYIRCQYYDIEKYEDASLGPFPKGYNPIGKTISNESNILPGVFNYLNNITKYWTIIITISVVVTGILGLCNSDHYRQECCLRSYVILLPFFCSVIYFYLNDYWLSQVLDKYEELEAYYKESLPKGR